MLTLSLNHLFWKALWNGIKCQRFKLYKANSSFSPPQYVDIPTFFMLVRNFCHMWISRWEGLYGWVRVSLKAFSFSSKCSQRRDVCSENVRLRRRNASKGKYHAGCRYKCGCIVEKQCLLMICVDVLHKVWTRQHQGFFWVLLFSSVGNVHEVIWEKHQSAKD